MQNDLRLSGTKGFLFQDERISLNGNLDDFGLALVSKGSS